MSLPRFTPGKVATSKPKPPQGQSHKTLTIKVKAHTRKVVTPRAPKAPNPNAQPITPGSSITAGQAAKMAANAVTVRYGPQQSQLQQNIQHNTDLGNAQAGWYDQYLKQLEVYRQDAQDRATATNAAALNQANSIRGIDQQSMNTNGQQMAADAASRGATVGPQVAQNATNASLVRQGLEGSFGALLAARGSAAEAQASNLAHVVGPGQKLQAQAQNARSGQDLLKQLADLKGQSGAYKQQFIDSLTQQEAKNILAASIAGQGYNLKAQTLKETHRRDTLNSKNAKARIKATSNSPSSQKTAADLAFFKQHGYYPPTGPPKSPKSAKGPAAKKPTQGPGSLTSGQESHVVQAVKGARAAALSLMSKPNAASGEVRQLLAAGKVDGIKYTHDEINAAFDLLPTKYGGLGGLSPANVKALHNMGIHVNGVFPILKVTGAQGLAKTIGVNYTGPN